MDIFLPEHKLVLEHDGYYYHSSMAARERAERKDRALRDARYQVLRICDSRELAEPVVLQKTKILYRFDEQDRHLDQMIASVFCYLDLQPLDFHHRRDQYAINQMYFHERKKRTLAVEYPAIALEWSTCNADKPDTVFSGSPRKVWWHCPKCQQEYRATIANRTKRRSNCPFCANLQAYEKNYLAVLRPEIAAEWHSALNSPLTPYDVVPGSEKSILDLFGRTCLESSHLFPHQFPKKQMPHLSSENWDAMRLGEAAGACAYLNLAPHKELAAFAQ